MEGNESGITPAEPVQDIHMPNGSIIPFILMSFGLFIAGFGAMYRTEDSLGSSSSNLWSSMDIRCNGSTFIERRH